MNKTKQLANKNISNKTTLTLEECIHFGNQLTKNESNYTGPVGLLNTQSLPKSRVGQKNHNLAHLTNNFGFDNIGLTEHNLKCQILDDDDKIPARFNGFFKLGHIAANAAFDQHDCTSGVKQTGGTVSLTCGDCTGRIPPKGKGQDTLGLGCFTWHIMQEKGGITVRFITIYCPNTPSSKGTGSAFAKQVKFFEDRGRTADQREEILKDLKELIEECKKNGEQIFLM
eukprot:559820-Ditylum_brightwellii.AAC.1